VRAGAKKLERDHDKFCGNIFPAQTLNNGTIHLGPLANFPAYTLAQQITDLDNSLWYLNVHDSTFPGGEIRGQIVPVPEPSILGLLGLGAAGLLCWRKFCAK